MQNIYLNQQLAELDIMSSSQLRTLWYETFGEKAPNAYHVALLKKRIAKHLHIQAKALEKIANRKSVVPIQRAACRKSTACGIS